MIKKGLLFIIKMLTLILVILLLIYLFKSCSSFGYKIFSDKAKDVAGTPTVVEAVVHISDGESLLQIGEDLEIKSVISNRYTFAIALRCMDDYDKIAEGDYVVDSSMKPSEILSVLISKEE